MVEDFDAEELPGADEVARDLDVRLTGSRIPTGMIMLCEVRIYVQ